MWDLCVVRTADGGQRLQRCSLDGCAACRRPPGGGSGAPTRRPRQALSRRRCGRCLYCSAQPAPAGTGRGGVMDEYLLARGLHLVSALVLFGDAKNVGQRKCVSVLRDRGGRRTMKKKDS